MDWLTEPFQHEFMRRVFVGGALIGFTGGFLGAFIVLRRGELVGMQMDRVAGGPQVMVPFCGKPAPFPLGPATLARATGTPLLPTFIIADANRINCTFKVEAPIEVAHTRDRNADVREATERLVAVYERYVRAYPEQWFNFFDFWNPPPPRRASEPSNTSQIP